MPETDVPRNPYVPFAATIEDMVPGTRLLIVGYNTYSNFQTFRLNQPPVLAPGGMLKVKANGEPGWYLDDIGVVNYHRPRNSWSRNTVTIVNTRENRRALYQWLIERGGGHDIQSATAIAMRYPRLLARTKRQQAAG